MNEILEFTAQVRAEFGTGAARALRNEGRVPAIIYGANKTPMAISVEEKAVDLHPVTDIVRHVDFVFLDNKTQKMEVPVVYEGKERALGVKRGGYFNIVKRRVTLLCDVKNIPRTLNIDVINMPIASSIKSSSVKLPEGCSFTTKKEFVLATIIGRRGVKAETEGETSGPAAK
jgi:large subunit ribosomal protein L25